MGNAKKEEVGVFLRSAKRALAEDEGLWIADRAKNNAACIELGLTRKNQEDIVLGLSVEDYHKGPEPDRDKPGQVWMFGPFHEGWQLYIKLKLVVDGPITHLKCISFHLAERPLALPHRKEEKK